jgi:hypothetical protein
MAQELLGGTQYLFLSQRGQLLLRNPLGCWQHSSSSLRDDVLDLD